MYKKCDEILNRLEQEGKIKRLYFHFPEKQPLKLRLKDLLDAKVDEKYYLSDTQVNRIKTSTYTSNNRIIQKKDYCDTLCDRDWKDPKCVQCGSTTSSSTILIRNKSLRETLEQNNIEKDISFIDSYNRNIRKDDLSGTITTRVSDSNNTFIAIKKDKPICLNSKGGRNGIDGLQPSLKDRIYDSDGISTCCATSNFFMPNYTDGLRIRKLTPKECWRLMGFDDEDFEKAAFKKEISYIEGGIKCGAKLKIVNETQRLLDTETYVLCTTNDMLDMETPIQTKWKKSILSENNEKMQSVNIVVEMLGDMEQKECATNIIKCGENTTILYTLMEELDQHHTAIIELVKRDKANIEKYMKITLEENLNPMKLYTISTLIEQIIKSKIYTYIVPKANIQGNIAIIEDYKKNLKIMKLSNLRMEYITRLNSDTMLYKQAGNSIVVNVLEAIFKELLSEYIPTLDKWSDLD